MTCFHPVTAYRSRSRVDGSYGITFNPHQALIEGSRIQLPCTRCIGCRIAHSKAWAVRCMHEAKTHNGNNCFVTLTYDDEHLPDDYSVHVRHLQLFMKKLRKKQGSGIRFFAAGEYGEENLRPHYHALLFGYRPTDLKHHSSSNGNKLYTSQQIQSHWNQGFSTIGELTYQTAAYTARYVIKKIGGDTAAEHYTRVHPLTGQLCRVKPEFSTQSRRPGIGHKWFETFKSDIYPSDFIVVDGKKHPVPKYYTLKLAEEEKTSVKRRRAAAAVSRSEDSTPERLEVRELVQLERARQLKRKV